MAESPTTPPLPPAASDVTTDLFPPAPPTGSRPGVGRYQLRGEIGRGAFGIVYRAYDTILAREVALKRASAVPADERRAARFLREARAAAGLRHPHIVQVYDFGEADGILYLAMERVDGQTLAHRIAVGPVTRRQAAAWVRDLAMALYVAHSRGVLHRDVKPGNVLLDRDGRAMLADFGLAGELPSADTATAIDGPAAAALTLPGQLLGTPAYMAPEQARGDHEAVGPRSDQYSLGVILYELLTGARPYAGSIREVLSAVADPTVEPTRPRALVQSLPASLEKVVCRAMAKDPARRYPSAADLAVDLQRWLTNDEDDARGQTDSNSSRTKAAYSREEAVARLLLWGAPVLLLLLLLTANYLRARAAYLGDGVTRVVVRQTSVTVVRRPDRQPAEVLAPWPWQTVPAALKPTGFVLGLTIGVVLLQLALLVAALNEGGKYWRALLYVHYLAILPVGVALIQYERVFRYVYEGRYSLTVAVRSQSGREVRSVLVRELSRYPDVMTAARERHELCPTARVRPWTDEDEARVATFEHSYSFSESPLGLLDQEPQNYWLHFSYADGTRYSAPLLFPRSDVRRGRRVRLLAEVP